MQLLNTALGLSLSTRDSSDGVSTPTASEFWLMEDGTSYWLMEDGTSKWKLESSA